MKLYCPFTQNAIQLWLFTCTQRWGQAQSIWCVLGNNSVKSRSTPLKAYQLSLSVSACGMWWWFRACMTRLGGTRSWCVSAPVCKRFTVMGASTTVILVGLIDHFFGKGITMETLADCSDWRCWWPHLQAAPARIFRNQLVTFDRNQDGSQLLMLLQPQRGLLSRLCIGAGEDIMQANRLLDYLSVSRRLPTCCSSSLRCASRDALYAPGMLA